MNYWNRNFTFCVAFILSLTVAHSAVAMDESRDEVEALLIAPAGVFDVETVDGEIVKLKIKSDADVPTSMRASRADRYAREKANREARASFTKFLGENVIFSESAGEGVVLEEKSGDESTDVMEASAKLYSSNSTAFLKGLIVLMDRIEGEGGGRTCTVVLGWSKDLVNASNTAKAAMTERKPVDTPPAQPTAVPQTVQKATGNTDTITRVGNLKNF